MINQLDRIRNALEEIEYMSLQMYFHLMERVKPKEAFGNNPDSWHFWASNIAPFREGIKAIQNCLRTLPNPDIKSLKSVEYFLNSKPFALRVIQKGDSSIQWDTGRPNDLESSTKAITEYIQALEDSLDHHKS